jgi:hypothetical protein
MVPSNLDLILEEWIANLKNKDRSAANVETNFEELFEALKRANATFDDAHNLLPKAIKAHLASPIVIRRTYKLKKQQGKIDVSEKEFTDTWNKDIADKGTAAMYHVFPRPKPKDEDEDDEPKVYGSMSVKEYKAQRKHAEQFPILDTEALERKVLSGSYNPVEDIANILGKKDPNGNTK